MPPHLHPRSRMTSSLFATTVVASFLVVGLPHLLPCPAPRVAYADAATTTTTADDPENGDQRRRRRGAPRQRSLDQTTEIKDGIAQFNNKGGAVDGNKDGVKEGNTYTVTTISTAPRGKRECPVPKPAGVIGELMGFNKREERNHTAVSKKEDVIAKTATNGGR